MARKKILVAKLSRKRGRPGSGKRTAAKFLDCDQCFYPCRVGDGVRSVTCGTCTQRRVSA